MIFFVSSLNWLLRSEAHFELAKIEEDIEQLDSAKNNLLKVVEHFKLSFHRTQSSVNRRDNSMIYPCIPLGLI